MKGKKTYSFFCGIPMKFLNWYILVLAHKSCLCKNLYNFCHWWNLIIWDINLWIKVWQFSPNCPGFGSESKMGSWWFCLQMEVAINCWNLYFPPLIVCNSRFWTFLLFNSDPLYLTEIQKSLIGFSLTTKSPLDGVVKSSGGHQT